MKVSVCITVFNEEKSIKPLLQSLFIQTKKPDEIVVVDGGSTDETVDIIKKFVSQQNSPSWIKKGIGGVSINLIVKKTTRAEGRNLSVKSANNEIIAITDADCVAKKDWLKKIIEPFEDEKVDIVAGFYEMKAENAFQQAEAYFLGITPERFSSDFLPSTRSIAFRKRVWDIIGGFPESDNNSAEDTDFNFKAVNAGAVYSRVKNARVEWKIPDNISEFRKKISSYAKWDAEYGIWWHPVQKLASHNIKALLILVRYLLGVSIIFLSFLFPQLLQLLLLLLLLYFSWAFYKVYRSTNNLNAGLWGIALQFVSDLSVMTGFLSGVYIKLRKHI